MDATQLWYTLAVVLVLVGLAGTVLPALPGIPLVFAGMLLAAWAGGFEHIGAATLVVLGILTLFSLLVDFWATAMGARRVGFTDPCTVAPYVQETGVDVLAVAFGTAHGVYRGEPHLDLDLLRDLRACTDIPLAMHGGSGLSAEQFRGAIAAGVSKINVFTELGLTTGRRLCEHAGAEDASYFTFQEVIRDTFRERCAEYVEVFGAAGRFPEGMGAEG